MLRTALLCEKKSVLVCLSTDNLAVECILVVSSRWWTTGFSMSKTRRTNVITRFFSCFHGERRIVPSSRRVASCSFADLEHILRHGGPPSPGDVSIELIRIEWTSNSQIALRKHDERRADVYSIQIVEIVPFNCLSKCFMDYGTQCGLNDIMYDRCIFLQIRQRKIQKGMSF